MVFDGVVDRILCHLHAVHVPSNVVGVVSLWPMLAFLPQCPFLGLLVSVLCISPKSGNFSDSGDPVQL